MPLDLTNPDLIKFLVDYEEKCVRDRFKWNNVNAEIIQKAATLHRKEIGHTTYDVFKSSMIAEMPVVRRDNVTAGSNRRRVPLRDGKEIPGVAQIKKGHSIADLNLGDPKEDPRLDRPDTDTSFDPVMRIVDEEQKSILYKNLPDFGKAVYLKNRYRMLPEDKYYFPECSSWDYGWRLNDSQLSCKGPSYGRFWRYVRDARSRTGPHPDPAYYIDPDINTFKICNK